MTPMKRQPGNAGRRGFTLVELMISIALVVLLLLGINQVFKMSSDTIGVGQTYSEIVRNARAVQTVMEQDAQQWVVEGPLFYIWNQKDAANSPRRDRLAFPARGLYRRQTGTTGTSGLEAWVWYGHAQQSNSTLLCRMALLLKDPATLLSNDSYIEATHSVVPGLASNEKVKPGGAAIDKSTCDVVGVTLEQLRAKIMEFERTNTTPNITPAWAADLRYAFECNIHPDRSAAGFNIADALAKAAPALLENCEEFIVEFAGDLYAQASDGKPTNRGGDGTLDYVVVNAATGERRPRWYGLGRDTDGDGFVKWQYETVTPDDFEKMSAAPLSTGGFEHTFSLGSPKLVRVLIKVVDPGERLREPQWFEYVLGPQ